MPADDACRESRLVEFSGRKKAQRIAKGQLRKSDNSFSRLLAFFAATLLLEYHPSAFLGRVTH